MAASEVIGFFQKQFGFRPTHTVQAPGRSELLGNHTDYNQGLVLALAVNKHVFMASSLRADGKVELASTAFTGREIFSVNDLKKNPQAPWADYVKGVLDQFRRRNIHARGFNAAIHSTIPMGAGMSSSAALEVATALTVRELFPFSLDTYAPSAPPVRSDSGGLRDLTAREKLEVAKLCQAAENEFVGVQCGLLDQVSSLFGKAFHAIELDCQSNSVEHVPMFGEVAVVVANTGVQHELVGGEYNALRAHCESAAKKLGTRSLRSVDAAYLAANKGKLEQREYECAYHIVGEIQRVVHGTRALRDGDFVQFGQYMFQSHDSSRDSFHNSTAELDTLVEIARGLKGCFGARLTGGGFGGATINLVHRGEVTRFIEQLGQEYKRRTGVETHPMHCEIADGAK
jgi:galactokinase